MTFTPTVTATDEGRHLEWLGRLGVPGIFDGRHSFTLEALNPSTTRFVQAERFTGCMVPFAGALLRRTAAGFEGMNHALAAASTAQFHASRSDDPAAETPSATSP